MEEEVNNWVRQVEADLRKAKILFNNREFDGVTFYSQQTAEKALKSIHLFKEQKLIKTHDLSLLGRLVKLPKELLKKAILLNPFYTASRYPILEEHDISNEKNADESLNSAEEILK